MASTALVDPLSRCSATAELYRDGDGVRWSFMLNLTNISYGTYGNNKFYFGQLIMDRGQYVVFRKWGRVGAKTPQSSITRFTDLKHAKQLFKKTFASKSGNSWPLKQPFERKKGRYVLVELDDDAAEEAAAEAEEKLEEKKKNMTPSKLPKPVQDIIKLICDPDVVKREMTSLNVDLKRFPLGKLSKAQISQGYEILQRLSAVLEELEELTNSTAAPAKAKAGSKGRRKAKAKAKGPNAATGRSESSLRNDLTSLSSEFYTLIPHDFGRSLPPVIGTMADLKLKLELLEVLSNLEISQTLQKEEAEKTKEPSTHPLDVKYNMLKTDMKPLSKRTKEYKLIERFINKTSNSSKLEIKTVLKIARPDEDTHLGVLQSLDNHKLLWHGSRLSNFVGILSQGLRIAPPEAPKNGYQFGKGLYFADALAKSANYCCATSNNPTAILLLADVALGTPYQTPNGEYLDYNTVKKDRGCDSTHGLGRMAPSEDEYHTLPDGVVVPAGTLKPVEGNSHHLLYNEFIVYRREQVKLRYLVAVDFNHLSFGW